MRRSRLPLIQTFTHAIYGRQSDVQRRQNLLPGIFVGLTEVLATLAVCDENPFRTHSLEHRSRDLARECALLFPMHVLSTVLDARTARGLDSAWQIHKRRADHDFTMSGAGHQRIEFLKEGAGLASRL